MKHLLSVLLPSAVVGLAAYALATHHYEHKLKDLRSASHISQNLASVQITAMAMSQSGCSNLFYLVVGEKNGVQTAGVVRSNSVALNVSIK